MPIALAKGQIGNGGGQETFYYVAFVVSNMNDVAFLLPNFNVLSCV